MAPRRKTAAAEAVQPPPADEAPPTAAQPIPDAEAATAESKRTPFPDVMEQKTVRVSSDGDQLRLLQSKRFNQMQIKSDGAIPDWAKERLKADDWRDRVEDEGIYTKQFPQRVQPGEEDQQLSSSRRRAGFEADRFFEQLANDIRAERKMPPIRLGTAAGPER
jgi:hypothetical protein